MELHLDLNKKYTYADYLTWLDDKRRELYNGFIRMMTPAPALRHQDVLGNLYLDFGNFLKKKKNCKVFPAPFDVRLPVKGKKNKEITTVLQPDLTIVCDPDKLDSKGCIGAPDMVVEISSPSTAKKDVEEKFLIYQEAGVKEYWIVHPNDQTVVVFLLDGNNKYRLKKMYAGNSKVEVNIFDGDLLVDLLDVFRE
jgi:Uma2 family endonuclease